MIAIAKAIEEAMKQQNISVPQLAQALKMQERTLIAICEGKKEPSLQELASLAKALHLNINELLHIHVNMDKRIRLEESMEIEINRIARAIPKAQRNRFVRAVKYLAECFEPDDESENRE